jgi:hypothetical protein
MLVVGRRLGGQGGFRNVLALVCYAAIPAVGALIFVVPIELGVFGISLFGVPPSPWELKPGLFLILSVINGGLLLWFAGLLVASLSVALGLPARKAAIAGGLMVCCLCALVVIPLILRS